MKKMIDGIKGLILNSGRWMDIFSLVLVIYGLINFFCLIFNNTRLKKTTVISNLLFWIIIVVPLLQKCIQKAVNYVPAYIELDWFIVLCFGIRILIAIYRLKMTMKFTNPFLGKEQMGLSTIILWLTIYQYVAYEYLSSLILRIGIVLFLVYSVYMWYYCIKKRESA